MSFSKSKLSTSPLCMANTSTSQLYYWTTFYKQTTKSQCMTYLLWLAVCRFPQELQLHPHYWRVSFSSCSRITMQPTRPMCSWMISIQDWRKAVRLDVSFGKASRLYKAKGSSACYTSAPTALTSPWSESPTTTSSTLTKLSKSALVVSSHWQHHFRTQFQSVWKCITMMWETLQLTCIS